MRLTLILLLVFCMGGKVYAEPVSCPVHLMETLAPEPVAPTLIEISAEINDKLVTAVIADLRVIHALKRPLVIIELTSGGGDVYAGFRLIKQIEDMGDTTKVVCIADIHAESMAFAILQSCPVRAMTKRTFLMTHEVHLVGVAGDAITAFRAEGYLAEVKAASRAYGEYVASRMHMPYAKYAAHVRDGRDWYFDHEQALKYKVVDVVVDTVGEFVRAQL